MREANVIYLVSSLAVQMRFISGANNFEAGLYCFAASLKNVLLVDFKPRGVAVGMIPGLPAYLLFKLLRFADYSNDDKMIKQLLQHIINGIKKVEKVGQLI